MNSVSVRNIPKIVSN